MFRISIITQPPTSTLFPYTTLFRSERVRFDRQRITSTSWTEYPILRFSEVPDVEVEVIQRPEIDPVGAGEAAHGPVTAAIDRKSTRLNSSHRCISYAVFCLKKKNKQ